MRIGTVPIGHGIHARNIELRVCTLCATPEERAAQAAADAGTRVGWCCYCDGWVSNAIMVATIPGNSGPGWTDYADATCTVRRVPPTHDGKPLE